MQRRSYNVLLGLCAALFAAAAWGSWDCGSRMGSEGLSPQDESHLRHLIYGHFALAQLAVAAACVIFYFRHSRWVRYYLVVSYNERSLGLNPPGIRMPEERVFRCCLGKIAEADLPPAGAPVLVYPLLMQSGYSSGHKLERELRTAYESKGIRPSLYYQPVLGASPWLAQAAAARIRPLLGENGGVLVVAHGSRLADPPPEPALFCRRLREILPGVEIALAYFKQEPSALNIMERMKAKRILVQPFLLCEGIHAQRDLPSPAEAAMRGKQLERLPVMAAYLGGEERKR